MITLKHGVKLRGMSPQIALAISVAESVYTHHKAGGLTVTSVNDGTHGMGSLHFSGGAVDLRTRNLHGQRVNQIVSTLKADLGEEFDVVLESDHIHIEWQPKTA